MGSRFSECEELISQVQDKILTFKRHMTVNGPRWP